MDAEDCEPFTDVYWIKFRLISNSRFAKRKLDEYVFLGNRLQVFYAPQFETLSDTKDKLECRRKEVLARLSPGKSKGLTVRKSDNLGEASVSSIPSLAQIDSGQRHKGELELTSLVNDPPITRISTDKDYFGSQSMNHTVQLVREKLNKIESTGKHLLDGPSLKRTRLDNRRRI